MAASLCCWWMTWGWVLWAVCCPKPSPSPGGRDPEYCLPITPYSWLSVPGDCGSQPVLLVNDLRLGPVSSVLPKTLSVSRGLDPQYCLPITPYSWLRVPGDCGSQPVLLVADLRLGPVSSVLPKTLSDARGPGPTILPVYYTLFIIKCPRWLWQPACAAGGWLEAGSCEQCAAQNPLRRQGSGPLCFRTGGPRSSRHPASGNNRSVRYSTTVSLHHHITA